MKRVLTIVVDTDETGNGAFLASSAYRACGATGEALVTILQEHLQTLGFNPTVNVFQDTKSVAAMMLLPKETIDALREALEAASYDTSKATDIELASALIGLQYAEAVGGIPLVLDSRDADELAELCPSVIAVPEQTEQTPEQVKA